MATLSATPAGLLPIQSWGSGSESFAQRPSDSSDNEAVSPEKRHAGNFFKTSWLFRERRRRPNQATCSIDLGELDRLSQPNRLKTFRAAFKYLRDLTPSQVDAFMSSYVIYNLDWADEAGMISVLGRDYRARVGECLRAYYGVLNHLCALGDLEKMYIPPLMDRRANLLENQLFYERAVARALGLKSGDRVLDLGCGRGRVAAHMATANPGVMVTGINIDPNQVAQARAFGSERRLANEFMVHDFNDLPLPFANGQFDAFYQIQALSLCKDLGALFRELYRVLKPGARISLLDWVSLPDYNPANQEHAELMRRVKPLIGAVGTPTPAMFGRELQNAGFTVVRSENASLGGLQAPLIDKVDIYFRILRQIILAQVTLRMLPPHVKTLMDRLCLDGRAFVKMDNMRLTTTSYWVVAEKPLV